MKTKRVMLNVLGLGCIGMITVAAVAGGSTEKVELCHVPPGDPSDAHTITVSVKASESHLANHEGDKLGACPPTCDVGESCDDGDLCTVDVCLDTGFCDNSPVDCDDGNQCTDNLCDPVDGCVNPNLPEGTSCEHENPCVDFGLCFVGGSGCRGHGSIFENWGLPCDDGNLCTIDDRFDLCGECKGGPTKGCGACRGAVCDPDTGECSLGCTTFADCEQGVTCDHGCCGGGPI